MMNTYLAVDFGGGSGRVMAGSICQGTLKLEEVYRFPNRPGADGKPCVLGFSGSV